MQLAILYLVTAVLFLAVDAVWLKTVMRPLFERHVGDLLAEDLRLAPAVGFYLCYVGGILWFASVAGLAGASIGKVALNAAILGFLAYGTYEATNLATLRGWSWEMAILDIAWGIALTTGSALGGLWITRLIYPQ